MISHWVFYCVLIIVLILVLTLPIFLFKSTNSHLQTRIIIVIMLKNNRGSMMYVCICHDVKDTQIKTAMQQGVDSMQSLQDTLLVGTCCGCCVPMVQDLVDEHHAKYMAVDAMAV